ncbi:sugar phosphate isomerase/epimerase family protein [Pseudactinotalea sp. Z1739]|uniref:sugar phosphate isomerase/epimerase family protein n=1 Tax=Pseudactinotalea sp. Z1739 TaxID=3413028 RepID=UPI003C7D1806
MTVRLAISGLGVPEAGLSTFLDLVERSGVQGVEIRHDAVGPAEYRDAGIRDRLGVLDFVVLASRVKVGAGTRDDFIDDLSAAVADANRLGATHVRVFPGAGRGADRTEDRELVARLAQASQIGRDTGVYIALETHDSHCAASDIANLLDAAVDSAAARGSLTAVWDVLHTWRVGESAGESLDHLSGWLTDGWIQVKDAVSRRDPAPELPGDGAVPLIEILTTIRERGYPGWVSLEWERVWFPAVAPLEVAIEHLHSVFRQAGVDWTAGSQKTRTATTCA